MSKKGREIEYVVGAPPKTWRCTAGIHEFVTPLDPSFVIDVGQGGTVKVCPHCLFVKLLDLLKTVGTIQEIPPHG